MPFSSGIRTSLITIGAFASGIIFNQKLIKHDALDLFDGKKHDVLKSFNENPVSIGGDVVDSPSSVKENFLPDQNRFAQTSKHGLPSKDSLRVFSNYILSYDKRNRVPNWVLEYITPEDFDSKEYNRKDIDFVEDKAFHHFFRATNSDYKNSGYDRGHLAAAGNYRNNPNFIKETFFLSNISPQVGQGFNRDKWNELEKYCRKVARITKQGIWICSGPLYLPIYDRQSNQSYVKYQVIGANHVAVPTHFFKVILYKSKEKFTMESFILPNQPIPNGISIFSYRVNPEVIERSAGILLFNHLPRKQIQINPTTSFA